MKISVDAVKDYIKKNPTKNNIVFNIKSNHNEELNLIVNFDNKLKATTTYQVIHNYETVLNTNDVNKAVDKYNEYQ